MRLTTKVMAGGRIDHHETAGNTMTLEYSRVNALLMKLQHNKNNLDAVDFGGEISDFTVVELEALSANLDRAIPCRHLVQASW